MYAQHLQLVPRKLDQSIPRHHKSYSSDAQPLFAIVYEKEELTSGKKESAVRRMEELLSARLP